MGVYACARLYILLLKQKNIVQCIECIEAISYVMRDKLNQLFFFLYYLELE